MTRDEVAQDVRSRFSDSILEFTDKSPRRIYIDISPDALVPMATYIFGDLGARFNIASGVDTRSNLEILYHFTIEEIDVLISLRVIVDRERPSVPSLAAVIKGTNWIEREIHELLGIDFPGHPDLSRLLLADEWPQGVYPLRQDYKEWDKEAVRDRGV